MSTTTDKMTVFAYSGVNKRRCTVLEITADQIDVGESISVLSQYPGEAEFLMPPLSCLEVVSPYFSWLGLPAPNHPCCHVPFSHLEP
jgi:hypothetical protein